MASRNFQELTPEQLAALPAFRDKWTKISLSTGSADRDLAEKNIAEAYHSGGFPPPPIFIWTDSPLQGVIAASVLQAVETPTQLEEALSEELWTKSLEEVKARRGEPFAASLARQLYQCGYGSQDASWLAIYDVAKAFGLVEGLEFLNPIMRLAENIGWWWPFEGACVISERAVELHVDDNGSLHSTTGPAYRYRDGYMGYAVHGVHVPGNVVERRYTAQDALKERNAEVKRIMIELMGLDDFFGEIKGEVLHRDIDGYDNPRELVSIPIPEARDGRLMAVHVICPTTGRHYFLGVPSTVKTCQEAVASTFGLRAEEYSPEKET